MKRALVLLLLAGCQRSFLHGVPAIAEPNLETCADLAAVSSVTLTATGATVQADWTGAPSGADGLLVEHNIDSGGWNPAGAVSGDTSGYVLDPAPPPDHSVQLRVSVTAGSCTSTAVESQIVYTPPIAATGLTSLNATNQIALQLTNPNVYASAVRVLRKLPSDAQPNLLTTLPGTATSFTDTTLMPNTSVDYIVVIDNPSHQGAGAALQTGTLALAPSGVTVRSVSTSSLHITWTDTNAGLASYVVSRRTSGGSAMDIVTQLDTSYVDTGLIAGTTYFYTVASLSTGGRNPAPEVSYATVALPSISFTSEPSLDNACAIIQPFNDVLHAADEGSAFGTLYLNLPLGTPFTAGASGASVVLTSNVSPSPALVSSFELDVTLQSSLGGTGSVSEVLTVTATGTLGLAPASLPPLPLTLGQAAVPGGQGRYSTLLPSYSCSSCSAARAAIGVGYLASCVLDASGSVDCWGDCSNGVIGSGCSSSYVDTLAPSASGIANAQTLALTNGTACAVLADGHVRCWGANSAGQCGGGTSGATQATPIEVCTSGAVGTSGFCSTGNALTGAVAAAAGASHACALGPSGQVWCWGSASSGELGNVATSPPADSLIAIPVYCADTDTNDAPGGCAGTGTNRPLQSAVGVAAGASITCAVLQSGQVKCWGSNASLQLGNAAAGAQANRPVDLLSVPTTPLQHAVAVSIGDSQTCLLLDDGTTRCLGDNTYGQLGTSGPVGATATPGVVVCDGTDGIRPAPGAPVPRTVAMATAVSNTHGGGTCLVADDGTVRCFGDPSYGELGDGTSGAAGAYWFRARPILGLDQVVALGLGENLGCAVRDDGSVWCWGDNGAPNGSLGRGTTVGGAIVKTPGPTCVDTACVTPFTNAAHLSCTAYSVQSN